MKPVKPVANNPKAYHDYFVDARYQAGIVLTGTEIKSVRQGAVNLKDSFCRVLDGELLLLNAHISPYDKGNIFNHDPRQPRKLLMHKREIRRLQAAVQQDGKTIVPLSMYIEGSLAKLEIGVCTGKKLHDKRRSDAEKTAKHTIDRVMKTRNR